MHLCYGKEEIEIIHMYCAHAHTPHAFYFLKLKNPFNACSVLLRAWAGAAPAPA